MIRGTQGSDRIEGLAGDDDLFGLGGGDTIFGNRGDDFVNVQGDGRVDRVDCRAGRDVVRANPQDNLSADCEVQKAVVGPK